MITRFLLIVLGSAMVLPAAPVFLDCFVFPQTTNPPRTCDFWDSGGQGGLYNPWTYPGVTGPTFPGVELTNFRMRPLGPVTYTGPTPLNPGDSQMAEYLSRVSFIMSVVGDAPLYFDLYDAQTTSRVTLTSVNPIPAGLSRSYDTELLRLDFILGGRLFRVSPTTPSPGETILADRVSGLTEVGSFFDVFLEISEDGGQSWVPSSSGSVHLEATVAWPEPGCWGFVLAGIAGIAVGRRALA